MHFERNRLSPGSLGFSPLAPGHPSELYLNTGSMPPSLFRGTSHCPGLDHLASGLTPVISGAFTPRPSPALAAAGSRFRSGFPLSAVNLTTEVNSLPRFPKRTTRLCKLFLVLPSCGGFLRKSTFRAVSDYPHLVSGSFHPAFAVLFSFLSPY